MCSLPNLQAQNLEELTQCRRKQKKETEVKTVKIVMPSYQPLENSI
jgi:hypothetical protein